MIDQKKFQECLRDAGIEFITGVPDSLLNDFCTYAEAELPRDRHIIAANEGNAIGLAAGYHFATGSIPLVYMQNSGIGNSMNPLISLANQDVYSVPLVLLVGWRGDPAVKDHVQHKKQGELTPVLLDNMDIPYRVIDQEDETAFEAARWAVDTARKQNSPTALIAKKGIFAKAEKEQFDPSESEFSMSREDAVGTVLKCLPEDALCVATTGRVTRELFEQSAMQGRGHDKDLLNVGAMGHASAIANGLALGAKNRQVVCFDGDAAAMMHMGAMTTSGMLGSSNMLHVVLNNGVHESVGGQPSAGHQVNFTAIAENSGYRTVGRPVNTAAELADAVKQLLGDGPAFIDIHIRKGIRADLPPLNIDHHDLKRQLMQNIRPNA